MMNHSTNPIVYLAFQVIPRAHNINNYELVDKAIEIVKSSGVLYQVGAMETTMKGSLNQLLEIVKKAQQACLDNGAIEVLTNIKIHNSPIGVSDTFCTFEF
jgi:uncharacterized protein YqgV (UPF0045/DUF77 family)